MSEFYMTTVSKSPSGYDGPPTITPDEKRNKVAYIVGDGQRPEVVGRTARLTSVEAASGFGTRAPDDEHFCVVIDCRGSLYCGLCPKKDIPTISVVPTGKIGSLAQCIHGGICVFAVGMGQVRPVDVDGAVGAQAAVATESAQKSVPTGGDGRPTKLTGQMAMEQKESLLEKIGLGAGKVIAVFYQVGHSAVQMTINTTLPFMGFIATLIGIVQAPGLGDWFSHLPTPLAGGGWSLITLGLICSLPSLLPLFGPGAVIVQITGILIGVEIGKGNISPRLSLPVLLVISTQNAYSFISVDMGLGRAEPETIEIGTPAALYSWFLSDVLRIVIVWLAGIGLCPQF